MHYPFLLSLLLHLILISLLSIRTNNKLSKVVVPKTMKVQLKEDDHVRVERKEQVARSAKKKILKKKSKLDQSKSSRHLNDKNVTAQKATKAKTTSDEEIKYVNELKRFIDRNQYYPRRALTLRQTGKVKIKLTINKNGTFENIEILENSPFQSLNKAAKRLFVRLGSFRPLPKGYKGSGEFIVPLVYDIKN